MKLFATVATACLGLLLGPGCHALAVDSSGSSKVVAQSFHKIRPPPNSIHITKRDDTLDLTAINNITGGGYYAEVEVGTPGQKMTMHLDTGSSDTWVVSADADLCRSDTLQQQFGSCSEVYDSDDSSTYEMAVPNGFNITYLDGNRVRGDYVTDSLQIGGTTIEEQQIGVGLSLRRPSGLMGLGLSDSVAARRAYRTVIENLVEQGSIGRAAYSVWLNDLQADDGTILFGGIDTTKYYGSLVTFPIVPAFDERTRSHYAIGLGSVSIQNGTGDSSSSSNTVTPSSFSGRAILDTGATLSLLPGAVAQSIFDAFDVDDSQGMALVDCALAGSEFGETTVDFHFTDDDDDGSAEATIHVPVRELVLDILSPVSVGGDTSDLDEDFESSVCVFGIQDNSMFGVNDDGFVLLGDTFLRSAYVVYDEANMQVGIAQAVLNATGDGDIIELASGDSALPTATGRDPSEASHRVSDNSGGGEEDAAPRIAGVEGISMAAVTVMFAAMGAVVLGAV